MKTKDSMIQKILDSNFKEEKYPLEGVIRFLPKHIDKYGRLFGWEDEEYALRVFIYIKNLQGYINYLNNESN